MPLMLLPPPSILPPLHISARLLSVGSGRDMWLQSVRGFAMSFIVKPGTSPTKERVFSPASRISTCTFGSSDTRCASTHPALPAPMMTTSASRGFEIAVPESCDNAEVTFPAEKKFPYLPASGRNRDHRACDA